MLLKFVASARAAGMRVSTAEVMDCLEQLSRVDVLDEAQFATVLRANLAKSRLEQARFDPLYQLFFHDLQAEGDDAPGPGGAAEAVLDELRGELLEQASDAPVTAAIADFMGAEPAPFLQLLQDVQADNSPGVTPRRGPGSNLVGLARRLPMLQALYRAQRSMERYLEAENERLDLDGRRELRRYLARRLEAARRLLTTAEPRVEVADEGTGSVSAGYGPLGQTPFANLSPGEIARVREVIKGLVRKLKDIVSLRQAARSRGVLDLKKTLRLSARTQGVPLKLMYRDKPPRKGRVVVLCDISGSVWTSARFMLATLYALQDCFDRVRSFVFIDEPVEITASFDRLAIDRALEEVFQNPDITFGVPSDYGSTLRLFRARYLDAVNKKTTLIVIGDGRSNYGDPEEGILRELRDRSRRLLWITPEPEALWGSGDSEMPAYRPYCNEARTCRNLNQLAAFFEDLIL